MKLLKAAAPFGVLRAESFIRGESTLSVICAGTFDDVAVQLESSIASNDLSVLQMHDFGTLLAARGVALDTRCRVYEVFDPCLAMRLITLDAGLAHILPCRISMHDRGDAITVTTPMPSALMTEFSHAADVARLARSFEASMHRVLRGVR